MGAPLTDFATINISSQTSALSQEGFGLPLILSTEAPSGGWGSDLIRFYNQTSDVTGDGFPAGGPTLLMVEEMFAQSPKPTQVAIGRRTHLPTQTLTVVPVVQNSTIYQMRVGATVVSYTSDGSATMTEISTGLKTAIDLLSVADLTTSVDGSSHHLLIAHGTAGLWTAFENLTSQLLTVTMDSTDAGVGTDLDAIYTQDQTWYAVLDTFGSSAEILALNTWCAANDRQGFVDSMDAPVPNTAYVASSNSDVAQKAKDATDMRVAIFYHQANDAFLAAGLAGMCLPKPPGSETWHAKQVKGVELAGLTSTQRVNLKNKNVTFLEQVAGRNITFGGKVASGEFIDVVRGRDWFKSRLAERVFDRISTLDKVSYDDDGISVIAAEVWAQLQEGIESGFLAAFPKPTVSVPLAANVSPTDKANRVLNNVTFTAVLAGAIHSTTINGVISLT